MKKKMTVLLLAAAMLVGAFSDARAIDFSAKGAWQFGFGVGDGYFVDKVGDKKTNSDDLFKARQRLRLQFDAVASEALSGSLWLEIGHQQWGKAGHGASLGADGTNLIKVRNAYIDWMVPQTNLKLRMGLQNICLPKFAGGGQVMHDADTASIVASYAFNDNVGLTAFWARPFNDNFAGTDAAGQQSAFLDNMDLFALTLPLKFDGVTLIPWAMYGARGVNTFRSYAANAAGQWEVANTASKLWNDGNLAFSLSSSPFGGHLTGDTTKSYGSMFWAGLPVRITALDPLNIEFDINYGYVEAMGNYDVSVRNGQRFERASTQRQGWLAKALVEYQLDWGVPGIFGWYASGDDGNMKNGSERMPSIDPYGTFTSFMGDATMYGGGWVDLALSYAGTWGIGLQVRDVSFVEDLKHTFRVAYWGGTNSTSMVKYFGNNRDGWNEGTGNHGPYLTTKDGMLEFNLNSVYQIYDNLKLGLECGYIVNMMDSGTWQDADVRYLGDSYARQDAWKANLIVQYNF